MGTRMGPPASTSALIDESDSEGRRATFVRVDNRAEEVAGQISSCRNPSSSRDTVEKEGARISSPLRTFAQTMHRYAAQRENVGLAKAARYTKDAKIFLSDPMAHTSER